jgi:hypothetical protein
MRWILAALCPRMREELQGMTEGGMVYEKCHLSYTYYGNAIAHQNPAAYS